MCLKGIHSTRIVSEIKFHNSLQNINIIYILKRRLDFINAK